MECGGGDAPYLRLEYGFVHLVFYLSSCPNVQAWRAGALEGRVSTIKDKHPLACPEQSRRDWGRQGGDLAAPLKGVKGVI